VAPITQGGSRGVWEFRTEWSPDGSRLVFCRAIPGRPSELWVMNADGSDERALTLGWEYRGADHPRLVGIGFQTLERYGVTAANTSCRVFFG
ncbi:MAG TPA: hypothetical protein ENN56_03025, partial [Firmicutes bacterium]|nr:hypothetical protein [Bacillota bacterium]